IRTVLNQALGRLGYDVRTTGTAATLWQWINDGTGDLVITDVVMPDENGLDLVPRIRKLRPDLRVIVMSAQNTLLTAVRANERGPFEYLPKPFDLNELIGIVERALTQREAPSPDAEPVANDERLPLIGRSAAMQDIYRVLARLMQTDLTVMITGESGTGKELVARALHDYGKRRNGPFVAINMAAIPRELIESELFGHEKGAFTGALARGVGRFEQAAAGTLFLDEIGDMPPEAQTRLLRVLRQLIRRGLFREDLFYRLNVVPLRLPPLRERAEDIPDLARHFLEAARGEGLGAKSFDRGALDCLMRYGWPGNVRELENLVRRLVVLNSAEVIHAGAIESELSHAAVEASPATGDSLGMAAEMHLRRYFAAHGGSLPARGLYDRVLHEIERPLISLSLEATRGNQIRAADLLGLNRNTLRKKIRELDIKVARDLK